MRRKRRRKRRRFFFVYGGWPSGKKRADRRETGDAGAGEAARIAFIDPAKGENGKRRRRGQRAKPRGAQRRRAGVAGGRKDRRQQRKVGPDGGGLLQLFPAVTGGAQDHAVTRRPRGRSVQQAGGKMRAVGADVLRQGGIAGEEKQKTSFAADRQKSARRRHTPRRRIIAEDERRSFGQGACDKLRLGRARGVAEKGERKRRALCTSAAGPFERRRRRC